MGVDMKEFLRIRDGPFTEWLEDTYPGKAGKNRRNSFLKYLPGVAKLAESLEEMRSEEGFKRIKEYDVEQATRGWHSVSLRNWDMFCKEQSGETPLGTQRDIVAERDNKRNANKAAKAAKATSKTAAKPAAKSSKEPVVKTKRAREPAKKIESPKRLKEEVWKAASSEDVATLKKQAKHWGTWLEEEIPLPDDCDRVPLFHILSQKLYFKGKMFDSEKWQRAIP